MSTDRLQRLRYILRKEHIANKKEKGILSRHKTGDEINVLPGTLWEDYEDKQTKKHEKIGFSYFSSLDFENLILSCPPSDVTRINHGEYELLASISTCADRMKVFEDKAWLGEGLSLDVGSYVHIHRYPNLPEKAPGVIKYKGSLSGIKGLWFGVELLEHRGKGCTNGMFRGHRYFVTDVDCGIFVTIARIRKCQDDNRHDIRQPQQQQQQRQERDRENEPTYQASPQYQASPPQQQQTLRQNATSPPLPNLPTNAVGGLPKDLAGRNYDLKISERVVWLGDTGPEFGCVRWIGTLPDKPEEVLVGVEFDNAVGSGTGRYKEHQLFRTRPNHASLIPILGLMKEDEYINPTPVKMPIDFYNDRPPVHRRGPTMGMNNAQRIMLKNTGRSMSQQSHMSQGSVDSDEVVTPPYSVVKKQNRPGASLNMLSSPAPSTSSAGQQGAYAGPSTSSAASDGSLDGPQSSAVAMKMASREMGKSDEDILKAQKQTLSPLSKRKEREKKEYNDHSKHNNIAHNSTDAKQKGPTAKDVSLKSSDKQKKSISFSDKKFNDVIPVKGRMALSSPPPTGGGPATKGIMMNRAGKEDQRNDIEYDLSNNDSLDEDEDHEVEKDYLGLGYPHGLSNSPSAHSGLSGISQVLSDISDSDSSTTTPTEPIYPRTTKATIEVPPKHSKETDKERVKEMDKHKDRVKGTRSPPQYGTRDRDHVQPRPGHAQRRGLDGPSSLTSKEEIPKDLELGSMVEVLDNPPKFGVIRWIGTLPEAKNDPHRLIAGLEMEEEDPNSCTDGTFNGRKIFDCPPKKGFFVYLNRVRKDSRFQESSKYIDSTESMAFGTLDSPEIQGNIAPPATLKDISNMFGKNKGIQGHHNSCYLDATLFSMYAFTQVFDTILNRPSRNADLTEYNEIQRVLKEAIVNPLRKNFYVRADKVLKLRTLLDKLSSVNGMMGEEKDPEEFLNSLLHDTMKADPFIKLSSGQESYFYQLFIEKDEKLVLPTTQQLLGLSFLQSDIKLAEIPSCLILQMPRFGKDYKMYQRIVPSLYLDITDILENSPRECAICGDIATYECKECYKQFGDTIDRIAFCDNCIRKIHSHPDRASHKAKPIGVPEEYKEFLTEQKALLGGENVRIHRETMELFAVVCIETSHYVAFVKCGPGPKAPWVFFDSMADRMGEQHGYNIPEVQPCRDLPDWLADDNHERILTMKEDRQLPEYARRILCDAYMCMYQSTEVMMYK